jgi:carbamate kinase
MSRIVLALGGNALGNTPIEQLALVRKTVQPIATLIEEGHQVIIAHGNGPQVGMINLAFSEASAISTKVPDMPFPECGAMSQGYIGYHLQNALRDELRRRGIDKLPVTVVTQVLVDSNDPAFLHPTKPIGSFYDRETAERIHLEKGYPMVEDAGRGYRRVIASPNPIGVIELPIIQTLMNAGIPVIACGGGGIPVVEEHGVLKGVDAVIDKDYASAKLAELLDADRFVILTAVEKVSLYYGKPNQIDLSKMTVADCERHIAAGHFAKGSMLPKVIAAMRFAASKKGHVAIIASLERAKEALEGASGTLIKDE